MAPLVVFALWARRILRAALPLLCAFALGALVVLHAQSPFPTPYAITAFAVLVAILISRARKRALAIEGGSLLDIELGVLLVISALAVVVHIDRSLDGRFFPLVYLSVGVLSAFAKPGPAFIVVLCAAGLDFSLRALAFGDGSPASALPQFAFMAVFATLNAAILRGEITRVRKASRSRLNAEIARLRDDARSYRLLAAPASVRPGVAPPKGDEERIARSGVEEIHQAVLFALRLLRESLGLHTAVLLWQNDEGTHLRISELASDASNLSEGPFLAGDGIFGAALSGRRAVAMEDLRPNYKLPYYIGHCPVRAVLALPVFEHDTPRGVLVVDRVDNRPFTPQEQELVEEAARYAVRAIHNERVFVQLERAKVEQGKLYRAAEALGRANSEGEVVEAGVTSAREIASVDFAAVTLYDEAHKSHEIRAVSGDGAKELTGQSFRHNAGLVSMVLQNRHPLPYRGEYDPARQVVFTRRLAPPNMPSLVVLPLSVHEQPLGTLVLASRRRAAFNDAVRSTLEVLASHMAVSLANARMVRRLEELATMDGLTGLLNKRAMMEVAAQKIASAKRFNRRLSVLVTDIDFFKKVNDTYGHDVGDVIIKGLGQVLTREKRNTDAVARFGGEEFVVICEETDARGAMMLAERVREELEKTSFVPPGKMAPDGSGPLEVKVTCSIGVATYPEAGTSWDELFKAADEALYVSKRSGRNQSTAWSPASKQGPMSRGPASLAPPTLPPPSKAPMSKAPMSKGPVSKGGKSQPAAA